jgi:Tfp pilus assembly PilM family ATPase
MSAFIKDILLPEKIKSYYLFPKIVVGIEINKIKITATKTRINGTTSTIEAIIEENISEPSFAEASDFAPTSPKQGYEGHSKASSFVKASADTTADRDTETSGALAAEKEEKSATDSSVDKQQEVVAQEKANPVSVALKAIFAKIGNYDEIHTVLPSSIVVFKELKLPFTAREKIKMVIGFEIEPLLPFSLRDAVIDFIITREIPEEKSSEILVTAIQKQHIAQHLALFETAGIQPSFITIDMISLYGLYRHIDAYKNTQGGTALINITGHSTAIAFMINGQLKTIRTLPKGIIALTKQIAQELNKTSPEIVDYLLRFGLEQTDNAEYSATIQKVTSDWWDSVNFTLNSFATQLLNRQPMTKIIFLGNGSLIKGLIPFISQKAGVSCELFTTPQTIDNASCTVKNGNLITPLNVISASATLPLPITVDYNLAQKEFIVQSNTQLLKQLIVLAVLTLSLFAALITHYYIQTSKLESVIHKSERQALDALTTTFTKLENPKALTEEVLDDARMELAEKQKRWFAFSSQSRASFLQYLLELSSKIDRKSIDLKVEQITIGEGILTLKGSVKDYEALKVFERELEQSQLFTMAEAPPETPRFTMRLTLVNSEEPL